MPHGRMPLPSFWKMVEDTLQQSAAQLHAFQQTFDTVTPSPVVQVGAGKGKAQAIWIKRKGCGFPVHNIWLRKWHGPGVGGDSTATVSALMVLDTHLQTLKQSLM